MDGSLEGVEYGRGYGGKEYVERREEHMGGEYCGRKGMEGGEYGCPEGILHVLHIHVHA